MFRGAVSKVMWVGRATVFLVGLSVIVGVVFGLTSVAVGADGQSFILGQVNTAQSTSTLDKSGAGPALSLKVDSGAPLAVNRQKKVANLNADQLDGVDSAALIRSASIYERSLATIGGAGPNEDAVATVRCARGDTILSGGFTSIDNGTRLIGSFTGAGPGGGHFVEWRNNATVDTVEITAICADTAP